MEWKRGLNVPVSKGGEKSKNLSIAIATWPEPLQCIFIVFEKITLWKISDSLNESVITLPNIQQQGFHKELGCLNAYFNLHKTLFHNNELGRNAFTCFLDTCKAFDIVLRQEMVYLSTK